MQQEQLGSGQGQRTEYYITLAERNGKTNKYTYTAAVDEIFVSARDASLFKEDIAKVNNGRNRSVFNCFCCYTASNQQKRRIKPGDPRNKTGLSPNIPSNADTAPQEISAAERIQGKPIRRKYPDLRYPKERHETQDYIQFKMLEYKGLNFERGNLGGLTNPL